MVPDSLKVRIMVAVDKSHTLHRKQESKVKFSQRLIWMAI